MFYTYNQSNPGGKFVNNDKVGQYVIIESDSADDANSRAENVGIYFDGCDDGTDCSCCGDRWHKAELSDSKGNPEPGIYGQSIEEFTNGLDIFFCEKMLTIHTYYKDGRHEKVVIDAEKAVKKNKAKERSSAEKIWAISLSGCGLYSNKPVKMYKNKSLKTFYDASGNYSVEKEGLSVEPTFGTITYASENKTDVEAFIAGATLALQAARQAAHSGILSHNCDKGPMKDGMEAVVSRLEMMLKQ